jgi:uncharacterized membrane protein
MRLATHTVWIARPRDEVFDFFADLSQGPRWRQYVVSMAQVGEGPLRAGARFRLDVDVNGRRQSYEAEVLVFERPARWRHRTFESEFRGYIEYLFETERDGTRVTMTIEARPATLHGWLAMPILALRRNTMYVEQLPRLKRCLEGGQGFVV